MVEDPSLLGLVLRLSFCLEKGVMIENVHLQMKVFLEESHLMAASDFEAEQQHYLVLTDFRFSEGLFSESGRLELLRSASVPSG